jgi:hypothetical protein
VAIAHGERIGACLEDLERGGIVVDDGALRPEREIGVGEPRYGLRQRAVAAQARADAGLDARVAGEVRREQLCQFLDVFDRLAPRPTRRGVRA